MGPGLKLTHYLAIRITARLHPQPGDDVLRVAILADEEGGPPVGASERDVQDDEGVSVVLETDLREPGRYLVTACVRGREVRCAVPVAVVVR